ncbi:Opi1 domain-containing protein [Trichoderma sp. SZMC 28014]
MDRNHMHRQTLASSHSYPHAAPSLGSSLAPLPPPLPPRPRPQPQSQPRLPHIDAFAFDHRDAPSDASASPPPLRTLSPRPLSQLPPNYSQIQHQHQHQHHHHQPPLAPLSLPSSSPSSMHSHRQFASPPESDRLPPLVRHDGDNRILPSLSSITSDFEPHRHPQHQHQHQHLHSPPPPLQPNHWPSSFNASSAASLNSYRQPPPFAAPDSPATVMDVDGSASIASATSPSPDRLYEGTPTPSSLTLDDPDVRLAAEALGDLRADFVSSPPDTSSLPPMSPPIASFQSKPKSPNPEPLLSLLTTAHPLVASTIGGASSAYGGAKNFSPRFKSGAEYVEGYLTPLANTVNSVGRVTGVEGGVRWFLGSGRRHPAPTSDPDPNSSNKRRRTGESSRSSSSGDLRGSPDANGLDDSASVVSSKTPRRLSTASTVDTLPAYDDLRSPAYSETAPATHKPPGSQPWQTRLMMSTSGLSVAMSAESLRSLKYCLRWLRWTNDHMNRAILNLKHTLEELEKAEKKEQSEGGPSTGDSDDAGAMDVDGTENSEKKPNPSRSELAAKINTLKRDILKTLQDVINNVSKYAGGALPENARVLVRRHLTSLPQRFRLATMSERQSDNADRDGDSALREGAQKVLVLAKEGLDMVTQVTGVLDGTIVSAEQWCERMGKKRKDNTEEEQVTAEQQAELNTDVKMQVA